MPVPFNNPPAQRLTRLIRVHACCDNCVSWAALNSLFDFHTYTGDLVRMPDQLALKERIKSNLIGFNVRRIELPRIATERKPRDGTAVDILQ